jgi:transposase
MARVPTIAEEDAKQPNRERDCLVGERTRTVNRIKSTLARLGIRNFKPTLRKAADRLATVHTPEACRCIGLNRVVSVIAAAAIVTATAGQLVSAPPTAFNEVGRNTQIAAGS